MKEIIEQITRLLLNGSLTKEEADKILLALHSVDNWRNKLKLLMEGLQIENIDLLLSTGKDGDYKKLGELIQKKIKELI